MKKFFIWIAIFVSVILIVGVLAWQFFNSRSDAAQEESATTVATTYKCSGGKSIEAIPHSEKINISLSDGRTFTLDHVPAASGARYANQSGSVVFWSKGYDAFFEESGQTTYLGCVVYPLPFKTDAP